MKMGAFVLGYHGCDKEVGEQILAGKADFKTNEENTWDWLGHGIYFWENNPKRAKEWAQFFDLFLCLVDRVGDFGPFLCQGLDFSGHFDEFRI